MGLAFSSAGNPNNVPLILLHAFPLDRQMWRHQLDGLSENAYVLAPDLPGFGDSPLSDTPGSMADYVKQIITFMDEQNIEQALIGGCSMGGYILFEFWRTMPRRIMGLMLCNTKAEADTGEQMNNRFKMAETVRNEGVDLLVGTMPEKLLGKTTQSKNYELVKEIEESIESTNQEGIVQAQIAMASRPGSLVTLESIVAPTLIIVGEEDELTPPSAAEVMHQRIPTADLVIVNNAGHLSPIEQPNIVNAAILNFLQSTCG